MNKKVYTLYEARELYKERVKKYEEAREALAEYHNGEYKDSLVKLMDARKAVVSSENDAIDAITREEARAKYNDAKDWLDALRDIEFACRVKMLAAKTVLFEACSFSVYVALTSVVPEYIGKPAGTKTRSKFNKELSESAGVSAVVISDDTVSFSTCGVTNNLYLKGHVIDRNNKYSNGWDVFDYDKTPKEYPAGDADWDEWCTVWMEAYHTIYRMVDDLDVKIKELNRKYTIGEASLPSLLAKCLNDDL